jgi:TonB family protein
MIRLSAISVAVLLLGGLLSAQETLVENTRKIVSQAKPVYPGIARNMNLEGIVKLEVNVAPNGAVKSVQAVGGSPVFVRAAEDAVYGFRWVTAKEESKEHVEIRFRLK